MENKKLKVVSVTHDFPGTSFLTHKFVQIVKSDEVDYYVICWNVTKKDWYFFLDDFKKEWAGRVKRFNKPRFSLLFFLRLIYNLIGGFLQYPRFTLRYLKKFYPSIGIKSLVRLNDDIDLKRLKPDIIHFEYGTLAQEKYYLKEMLGCKLVVSFRGYDLNYMNLTDADYYRPVWENGDGFHFLGTDLRNRAVKRGYRGDKQEALISPAIDIQHYRRDKPREASAAHPFRLVSVGRLHWKKAFENGVRATRILKDRGIDFTYHIIGDGPHLQAIEYTIYELGLEKNIKVMGKLPPRIIKEELEMADVFLHPAISEGFCNAVIEAQAMQLPVVTTDADGLAENIAHGETGYIVPKWDVEAMGKRLLELYQDSGLRQKMGVKGRERVEKYFRLEKQAESFIGLYKRI